VQIVQVDAVNAQKTQAPRAGLLAVLGVTLGRIHGVLSAESELCGKEDLVTFASPLEPFANELLAVAIDAEAVVSNSFRTWGEGC
jgi:hypothetical protein